MIGLGIQMLPALLVVHVEHQVDFSAGISLGRAARTEASLVMSAVAESGEVLPQN
jgi:hypothetical protein